MRGFGYGRARQPRRFAPGRTPGTPVLAVLTLAAHAVIENSAAGTVVGGLLGRTAGSTLALVDTGGDRFAISGANLVAGAMATDFETATNHGVTVRETLAGHADRDTVLTVTVSNAFEQPGLVALGLSATSLTIGTAAAGAITGATAGSTIAATGLPTGLTINGAARTWSWTGGGSAGAGSVTLTETLGDSANSPRASTIAVTVVASPATLPSFRSALAAARAGTAGPVIVNVIGDSTVAGTGGGSPASTIGNNARGNALNQKLGDAFAAAGLGKNGADVFGLNFPVGTQTAADYAAWNTSVTPGGWSFVSNLKSISGNMWNAQATGAGDFTWTAEGRPFTKLVLYYAKSTGLGTFKVLIDGADMGTIVTAAGAAMFGRTEITVAAGTHGVAIRWVSGSCYLIGLETVDTTNLASVRVRNLGQGSARSSDIVDNATAWAPRNALAGLDAAQLHVIEGGLINDWLNGVAVATVSANLATMMTAAQIKGGDVLLLGPTRSNTTTVPAATQQSYVDAMAALANGTTRISYDLKTDVGDYAAMNGAGRMFDAVHPNAAGYAAEAVAVYGAVTA